MANLITEQQKKNINNEYTTRVVVAFILVVTMLGVFFLAYVIPYYFLLVRDEKITAVQFQSVIDIENKENIGESVSRVVTRTLDELRSVESYNPKDSIVPSAVFAEIIKHKNASIRITRLSFVSNKGAEAQLSVSGISKNRDGLVTFVEDLKSEPSFTSVESPISDLAKSLNIAFTVSIKMSL